MALENSGHDSALNTDPLTVNDPNLSQPLARRLPEILFDNNGNIARSKDV
jgi:hypothetical protein